MVRVKIWGGLGNQLFQYAFAKNILVKYGYEVEIEKTWYQNMGDATHRTYALDRLNCDITVSDPNCSDKCKIVKNEVLGEQIEVEDDAYYVGYWQNPAYFTDIKKYLVHDFQLKHIENNNTKSQVVSDIKEGNTVSIHVRRGDYLRYKGHPLCSEEYYKKAISIMEKKYNDARFYVFSDDLDWCKSCLSYISDRITFVDTKDDLIDWFLMSKTRHHIIANSSYSWWAAWIGDESGTVIMPQKWLYSDAYDVLRCDGWIWI